jgi:predicted DNA-binding protein
LHDEINEKAINLATRVGKLTADEIKKALEKILADMKNPQGKNKSVAKGNKTPELKRGKQTLKQLSKQNAGLSSVELKNPNLRLLNSTMKQHGVDFAAVKDGKGKYTLFFKGKDADTLTHAFKQYTGKLTQRANRPSIKKTLSAMKQKAQSLNAGRDKVKNRDKGAR